MKSPKDIKMLAIVTAVIIVVVIGVAAIVRWDQQQERILNHSDDQLSSDEQAYNSCIKAGGTVQESFPEVCITTDGKRIINPRQQNSEPM